MIGGLQKTSLIDYPGKIAAIIFLQGCPFRCPFCHNPDLVLPERFKKPVSMEEIFAFLDSRKGKLDGVVISGGEPTIHNELISLIINIKKMGFLVKLDTNGCCPNVLKTILKNNLVDYIAMDIKAPFEKYNILTGISVRLEDIKESISLISSSEIEHEFRTTYVDKLLTKRDIKDIKSYLADRSRYNLQKYIPRDNMVNPDLLSSAVI